MMLGAFAIVLAFIGATTEGDPLFLADRTGADAHPVFPSRDQGQDAFVREAEHNHNPVWSPDGQWIYVVHGTGPTGRMDFAALVLAAMSSCF